jgi:electron transfer flavoprotein-quinone oxidoreductase
MAVEKVEIVVVGAGLAGLAAAYFLADSGCEVLVVERGDYPGSKNVSGGRLYLQPVQPFLSDLLENAPFERRVVKERLTTMTPNASLTLDFTSERYREGPPHSCTILRATFDQWLSEKVAGKGALVVPGYKVDDLIMEGRRVLGIRAGEAEVYANVVIAADGALSFLTEKVGLRPPHDPHKFALGIKEVIEIPSEKIQERFGLTDGQGAAQLFFGSITEGMMGGGFLYTNRSSLSLGLVIGIHALMNKQPPIQPHDLMEAFKNRPEVQCLIEGGTPVEYSAHVIPEGAWRTMNGLVSDGFLAVGDAAGLSLNQAVTVRGMDLALVSGALAAQAILQARQKNDFSAQSLSLYPRMLQESSLYQDMLTFQQVPQVLNNPRLLIEYPQAVCELLEEMMWIGTRPKEKISSTVLRLLSKKFLNPTALADLWTLRHI